MVLLGVFSKWDSFFQLIGVLLIFLFVLAITYVTTRWIGQYQQGMMQNKNIQVVETFRVSNNKFIQIIQVGKKYLVISVCKDVVNILTELTEEDLVWMPSQEERGVKVNENFQQIFTKLKDKIPRK
ncbi:MAG: flagellar biosynthetic protein FliO [Lachnospiraceae bacterium]|jgi:flagellar protein FliO/FliZ|nr:flagellar biosynthetic protein FliO [Lachnospiraceae bacterium]